MALDHLLAAYRHIDIAAAKPEQAKRLAQQYQDLVERSRSIAGDEAAEQVNSLIEFLSGQDWQTRVGPLRSKLDAVWTAGDVLTIAEAVIARHTDEMLDALFAPLPENERWTPFPGAGESP